MKNPNEGLLRYRDWNTQFSSHTVIMNDKYSDSSDAVFASEKFPNVLNWVRINNRISGDFVSNHFLIWIDILGYKNHADCPFGEIHNLESVKKVDSYLHKITDAFNFAIDICKRVAGEDPKIRIFSDNILLYCKLYFDHTDQENIMKLLYVASSIQWVMTGASKILVRGAATIGLFYSNDRFVYGPALIEAYSLETNESVYPRILISENLLEYLETNRNKDMTFDELYQGLLLKDEDGRYCIDGLSPMYWSHTCLFDYGANIEMLKDSYVDKSEKLKGMMNYTIRKFNEFCERENIVLKLDQL